MFNRIALALIVLIAVPYYWLLMERGPTSAPMLPIDLARLRAEAAKVPGPRPQAVEYAVVASQRTPGTLLVAGGGLKTEETGVFVWRLVTPGGDTIINAGLTQDQALASGFANFDGSVQTAVVDWLSKAQRILFTSEDIDHIGGLVALVPSAGEVAGKVAANDAQIRAIGQLDPRLAKALAAPVEPLSLSRPASKVASKGYAALAPGIAAVRTPGHLPGSQMIYVQLQDGREYLFAGDTAPMRRNVSWLRPRSRYAAHWQGSEDRSATMGWIKGLAALQTRYPRLKLVFGHDLGWLQDKENGPQFVAASTQPAPPASQSATTGAARHTDPST
jgi:glyoxylase-like metal-dependent hydrolase (beta-lactamase superfamily II)